MKKTLLTSLAVLILGSSVAMASPQEWPGRYDPYPARIDAVRYDRDAYAYHRYEERMERIRRARLRRLEELRRIHRRREEERWRWERYRY